MPTYVIVCKAKPPVEGIEVVDQEVQRAHRYFNRLVELQRAFQDALDDAKRRHHPGLAVAEQAVVDRKAAVAAREEQIRLANAAARRKRATPEDRQALADDRAALKAAYAGLKAARQAAIADAGYQADVARLVEEYQGVLPRGSERRVGGHFKEARRDCGVYPGTYLRVEAAVEQATKTSYGRPAFRRWTGDGLVGPQLTPALAVADLAGGDDRRLRMELVPGPVSRRRSQRVLFHVRVQSNADGSPVWARVAAHLSRGQLPDDAQIKWASLVRRQVGLRRHRDPNVPGGVWRPYYEWSVQLTIQTGREKERAAAGACGVNVGWRAMADGSIRVGYLVGTAGADGAAEDIRLPAELARRFDRSTELRSVRDLNFNATRDLLVRWLGEHPAVPEWLTEMAETLGQWRSARRLGGLQGRWARERFAGDDEAFDRLTAWRVEDVQMEQEALMVGRAAARARLDHYRKVAARLRTTYRTIVVDDTKVADLKRQPQPEDNRPVNRTAAYNVGVASPGLLRSLLVQAGAVAVAAADITRVCHACGQLDEWDRQAELVHTCSNCGRTWDQDENAARNLLARAPAAMTETPDPARDAEPAAGDEDAAAAPAGGGRWHRRKAERSRRRAEQPGA